MLLLNESEQTTTSAKARARKCEGMLSGAFAFWANIFLDTRPKTITFVANGNSFARLRKNSLPVSVVCALLDNLYFAEHWPEATKMNLFTCW